MVCIARVRKNKWNEQKLVTIPKNENIKEGEYVLIQKIKI